MSETSEMNGLSIVIPAYNEERAIVETIEHVTGVMEPSQTPYEVVLVNDGSTDKTAVIIQSYLHDHPQLAERVRLVEHAHNRGYGASLKTGIRAAKNEAICITDADGTYPNNRIPELFGMFRERGLDMVVGRRSFKKLPTLTKPAKWFITKLASFLVDDKIPDINSGLRIFRRSIAVKFFPIICDGFSFTTTITLAMFSNGYQVHYEPIEYFKRKGKSKIRPIRDTINFIQLIIRTVAYFNPLKVFVPVSLLLFLVGFLLFIIGRMGIFFAETPNDTITILFVGGIQVLATGVIADMIAKKKD